MVAIEGITPRVEEYSSLKEQDRHVRILERMIQHSALGILHMSTHEVPNPAIAPSVKIADRMISIMLSRSKTNGMEQRTRESVIEHQYHLNLIKGIPGD